MQPLHSRRLLICSKVLGQFREKTEWLVEIPDTRFLTIPENHEGHYSHEKLHLLINDIKKASERHHTARPNLRYFLNDD